MNNETNRISKYFSYLLRHNPQEIGLQLDENGWASITDLINKTTDFELDFEIIRIVVETNDKQRFSISDDGMRIRANQGHSIDVDLALEASEPPQYLWHGTAERFLPLILEQGLDKRSRHHVHLTESEVVASNVGSRYGKLVLLVIDAKRMAEDGYNFYRSANNVWLVESVPVAYIKINQ